MTYPITGDDVLRFVAQWSQASGLSIIGYGPTTLPAILSEPIAISKGTTWVLPVTWYQSPDTPRDLSSGFTALFEVRGDPSMTPFVSLTNIAGITLGDGVDAPNISITLSPTATGLLTFVRARGHLDITQTSDGRVWRLFEASMDLKAA